MQDIQVGKYLFVYYGVLPFAEYMIFLQKLPENRKAYCGAEVQASRYRSCITSLLTLFLFVYKVCWRLLQTRLRQQV